MTIEECLRQFMIDDYVSSVCVCAGKWLVVRRFKPRKF